MRLPQELIFSFLFLHDCIHLTALSHFIGKTLAAEFLETLREQIQRT